MGSREDIFEDVTTTIGMEIRKFLKSPHNVQFLNFPCLNRLTNKSFAYRPSDYFAVADCIGLDKVAVYRTNRVNRAGYGNKNDGKTGDVFLLACDVADNLVENLSIIVHEATHMIQDFKKLKITRQEMEMDAHFAQSLYRVKTKCKTDKANSNALMYFDPAAENHVNDSGYLKSNAFRRARGKLRSVIVEDYGHLPDLTKKVRQDGIIF